MASKQYTGIRPKRKTFQLGKVFEFQADFQKPLPVSLFFTPAVFQRRNDEPASPAWDPLSDPALFLKILRKLQLPI